MDRAVPDHKVPFIPREHAPAFPPQGTAYSHCSGGAQPTCTTAPRGSKPRPDGLFTSYLFFTKTVQNSYKTLVWGWAMTLIQKIIPMQSHQFHNLQGNRQATESCESWSIYTEEGRREQETKQHVNRGIYNMDIQAPSPHDSGSSNSRRSGPWCSEADIEYGLFTVSHILTALQTCPGSSSHV